MTENCTRHVFDATASTYDKDRARLIPGCETFYRWALELIPLRASRIVELGAGSGLFSAMIRNRFPEAELELVDFSGPMLELAKQRLGDDPKITYTQADYLAGALPEGVCAVVSSLSIHHLEDGGKQVLFRRAHAALRPGGVFLNADHVAGATAEVEQRYQARWLRKVRELGATEEQIEASLYRQREDRRTPVGVQLGWMREAGFADADCWYKEAGFAVMAGTR